MSAKETVLSKSVDAEHGEEAVDAVAIIDEELLRNKIYEIRGQKVMLDFELAEIYGYSTKAFNQQVQRNIEKFDDDFRFQLTDIETLALSRSQNVTLNRVGRGSNFKYNPYAFTEQGVYMLMTVLKGELATKQSKALIRLFKQMKDYVVENQPLVGQRDFLMLSMQVSDNIAETLRLRRKLNEVEDNVAAALAELGDAVHESEIGTVMEKLGKAIERYGFLLLDGHPIEAAAAYASIYELARESLIVVDNYVSPRTLELLANATEGVKVMLFTDNKGKKLHASDIEAFRDEYPSIPLDVRSTGDFVHDRFIVLDYGTKNETIYLCGGSSKDAGVRATTIVQLGDPEVVHTLIDRLLEQPLLELP
ncbi:MAG: ORF6N domain-containing protein [Eggerthellaceae bacterium]|nr:ORF6N domain-containing protein [Eggerthellaceae bacterium]